MKILGRPTKIDNPHLLPFSLKENSWYLVSISARLRSKKQRGREASDDEDLRIEIDNRKFPKLENHQRYFDSPAAFSGAKLRNNLKTVFFVIYLNAGKHSLSLIPDEGALVKNIEVTSLTDFPNVSLELNQQAEKANGRPWMTFVLVDLGLKSFTTKVTVNWRFPDGDDIKIIVDGKTKKNNLSILHRNWIFASNVLWKLFGREIFEKTFVEKLLQQSLHYIEFWSDEGPTIKAIGFELVASGRITPSIQVYRQGNRGEDYNRFDKEIEKAVKERNSFFLNEKYPPPTTLDPNLIKAMIYVESRMGYGISPTGYPAYPDVMQVGNDNDPALHVLNNDHDKRFPTEFEATSGKPLPVDYDDANANTSYESIYWGTRWLYHKAQDIGTGNKQIWYDWRKAVSRYGPPEKTYVESVWNLYKYGKEPNGGKDLF